MTQSDVINLARSFARQISTRTGSLPFSSRISLYRKVANELSHQEGRQFRNLLASSCVKKGLVERPELRIIELRDVLSPVNLSLVESQLSSARIDLSEFIDAFLLSASDRGGEFQARIEAVQMAAMDVAGTGKLKNVAFMVAVSRLIDVVLLDVENYAEENGSWLLDVPEDELDYDLFDCAHFIGIAICGGHPGDPDCSSTALAEYWRWYLLEAVPSALHPDLPRSA